MRHILWLFAFVLLGSSPALAQPYTLGGQIAAADQRPLDSVKVVLYNSAGQAIDSTLTSCSLSSFSFANLPAGDYELLIEKTDDTHLNGLSTLDIVLASRIMLGHSSASGLALLAADVDADGSLNILDLLRTRQVVLGIANQLPAPVWRFVRAGAPPAATRWPVNLSADLLNFDFTGVKTGDLNLTFLGCL